MIWGKNVTVLTKRINTKSIFNKKVDIYERCCTFDGPEIYSDSSKTFFFTIRKNILEKGILNGLIATEIMKFSNDIVHVGNFILLNEIYL